MRTTTHSETILGALETFWTEQNSTRFVQLTLQFNSSSLKPLFYLELIQANFSYVP